MCALAIVANLASISRIHHHLAIAHLPLPSRPLASSRRNRPRACSSTPSTNQVPGQTLRNCPEIVSRFVRLTSLSVAAVSTDKDVRRTRVISGQFLSGHGSRGCYNHPNRQPLCFCNRPTFISDDENDSMKTIPTLPNAADADVAVRIALVREMTEAARNEAIAWSVRDRRLRALFRIEESSRAFDSSRPC
jgi:hypothetical protein